MVLLSFSLSIWAGIMLHRLFLAKQNCWSRQIWQISLFPLSFLNKIEGAKVQRVFGDLIENEPAIIAYFPDNCLKRTPPKVYFWKIYNLLKPELFRNLINSILDNAPRNGNIADIITIDPLIAQIFNGINNDRSLTYRRSLKSQKKGKSSSCDYLPRQKFKEVFWQQRQQWLTTQFWQKRQPR